MKRLFITLLVLILGLNTSTLAEEWYDSYAHDYYNLLTINYCAESVSMRDEPNVGGDVLAIILKGEKVIQLEPERRKSGFIKINYRGKEGYILEGYTERTPTALRIANCDEQVSFHSQPDKDSEHLASLPLDRLLYSSYQSNGFASTAMMNTGYGYIPLTHLMRADKGQGCTRYVANCGSSAKLYRYATTHSDVIDTIPAGRSCNVPLAQQCGYGLCSLQRQCLGLYASGVSGHRAQ